MQHIIFALASFLIAAFAFGFGAAKLFRKRKPMYLQLLVCAAGCFALQQMSRAVNLWCGAEEAVSVGMLGIFGCNFFLLSANYGTLDRIVDDRSRSEKAGRGALVAPAVLGLLAAAVFFLWRKRDLFCAFVWLAVLLPALPASYYNLKHILMPVDPFELLRATRPCNFAALAFYLVTAAYAVCSAAAGSTVSGGVSVLMSLAVLALSVCAVKGAERWGI